MKDGNTREERKAQDIAKIVYALATMTPQGVQAVREYAETVERLERPMVPAITVMQAKTWEPFTIEQRQP